MFNLQCFSPWTGSRATLPLIKNVDAGKEFEDLRTMIPEYFQLKFMFFFWEAWQGSSASSPALPSTTSFPWVMAGRSARWKGRRSSLKPAAAPPLPSPPTLLFPISPSCQAICIQTPILSTHPVAAAGASAWKRIPGSLWPCWGRQILGLPLQTGRGLREILIIRQYFRGLGHSGVIYNLSLQDLTAKPGTWMCIPLSRECHTMLYPGRGGISTSRHQKRIDREGGRLVGTREPNQVMKVFECHAGMLGPDPGPWEASKELYVEKDVIRFSKWLSWAAMWKMSGRRPRTEDRIITILTEKMRPELRQRWWECEKID